MIDLERAADWMAQVKPVRTEAALCVKARSPRSSCNACVEVCPAQAISLTKGPVIADSCTVCGLCTAACRTGALRMETPSDAHLLDEARKAEGDPLVIACASQRESLHLRDRLVAVPCIGAVTPELLVGMLATCHAQIVLWRPAACDTCANGQGCDQLVARALAAVDELYPGSVRISGAMADVAATSTAAPAAALDGGVAADRRAFLGSAIRSGGGLLQALLGDWFVKPAPPKPAVPIYEVQGNPRRRQVLHDAMAVHPPASGGVLPERARAVTPNCTLCLVCSRLCPSGALSLHEAGQQMDLRWQASRCTDCGLCQDVCPVGAMGEGGKLSVARFQSEEPERMMQGEQAVCACGARYWRAEGGPALCFACRIRQ